ncbi:isopenicillin N synthase family dioxygenase [Hydrocarboniclastica marina]|uniref:2-oxoglutarate-dependent ethylene/succinate-forming enzyme n=1 Tax=Hydrocarboniclastica marina TaxID=2259620 RepID=A0A4P7XK83_9ALTE|nr:2-oxoglutarate and iron-dependent oxygenase domain-containing protein [Hydrocarboniclastica marina]MAM00129.1 oxidoreductase [Alteromonadaceae bacterium]QCF27438.1 isopenicillin N synthase family oxygenase [Hydrocarboniclastica marina]
MPEHTRANSECAQLPLIDIGLLASERAADHQRLAQQLAEACRGTGFFYVRNHGVSQEMIDAVFLQTQAFFKLPTAEKERINKALSLANRGYEPLKGQTLEPGSPPDLKEGFYIGEELNQTDPRVQARRFNHGANQWPESLPKFRSTMTAYFDAMNALSARIMQALALSLDLPRGHFSEFCRQPLSTLRLLHYPPQPAQPEPGEKGCGAHTDFGGVTVLLLDHNPGLQVWDNQMESWINADPIPGTFVVNLGDMIARWTNDRYRSTLHRVVNSSGTERYSVPFFYSGNPDHEVACLPGCLAPGEFPLYPATTVENHLIEMYRRTYA